MRWTRRTIIEEIKNLQRNGAALNYAAAEDRYLNLVRAAAWHFGTWRRAVESAGINYERLSKYRRWDRERIVARIRELEAEGKDLSWRAISLETDPPLAAAALRPNGFTSWREAVSAAGLDINEVARYQCWDRSRVLKDIKALHRSGHPLASKDMQEANQPLFCAARRRFGSWDEALVAAGLDALKIRRRKPSPALHLPRRKRGTQPALFAETEIASTNGAAPRRRGRKPSPELQAERERAARAAQLSFSAAVMKGTSRATNGASPAAKPGRAGAAKAAPVKTAAAKAAVAARPAPKKAVVAKRVAKKPVTAKPTAKNALASKPSGKKAIAARPVAKKLASASAKKPTASAAKATVVSKIRSTGGKAKLAPGKVVRGRSAPAAATIKSKARPRVIAKPTAKKVAPTARAAASRRGRGK